MRDPTPGDDYGIDRLSTSLRQPSEMTMVYRFMKTIIRSLHGIPDDTLLSEVKRLAADEREATARLIASLTEVDTRRLYLGQGCSSLFTFCTEVLRLSEHAAYERIEAARVCRRFPAVLELLTEGAITLTTVTLLGPHLTGANHRELLAAARHRKRREVEHLVARLRPQPDVRASTRKLPVPKPHAPVLHLESDGTTSCDATHSQAAGALQAAVVPPVRPPVVAPIAPARFKVQMTIGEETHQKLRRAQDLLRHVVPSGDLAAVFDRALTVLVADLEKRKLAKRRPRTAAPTRPRGRHVPAAVRRAVWARDGGRCTFVGPPGRCSETVLELHHVVRTRGAARPRSTISG